MVAGLLSKWLKGELARLGEQLKYYTDCLHTWYYLLTKTGNVLL
jgi:hypothetical protein